jgi:hypothetical protein
MSVKLLKDLDFAAKINESEAITEAGKDVLKTYRSYVYSNPVTYGIVNGFVLEASKYAFDAGLANILESVNKFISENNISWKLATACENINANNSNYNYINKFGAQQVEKLLEMNESDVISYIKAGSLKGVQYVPEFRQICKEVYKQNITESRGVNYTVVNPISYVLEAEDTKYFQVLGKAYKLQDNKIDEAVVDDAKFNRINALLENFKKDENGNLTLEYSSIYNDKAQFILGESTIKFVKGEKINEEFENTAKFNEYVQMVSKAMNIQEKLNFNKAAALVSEVFESIDNIIELDNVKLLKTSQNVLALVEAKDNVNLTVFNSMNAQKSSKNYDFVVEALNDVIKISGIDLKSMFESRIDEDCKKQSKEYDEIKEQLEANKDAQFLIRKKKIAQLAEAYKTDPIKIALLSKVAKDLAILEKKN